MPINTKYRQIKKFLALSLSDVVLTMLINKCKNANSFITSRPGVTESGLKLFDTLILFLIDVFEKGNHQS